MKLFRITSESHSQLNGIEFEVDDDASEDEIADAALEAAIEYISYGWEEIKEEEDDK